MNKKGNVLTGHSASDCVSIRSTVYIEETPTRQTDIKKRPTNRKTATNRTHLEPQTEHRYQHPALHTSKNSVGHPAPPKRPAFRLHNTEGCWDHKHKVCCLSAQRVHTSCFQNKQGPASWRQWNLCFRPRWELTASQRLTDLRVRPGHRGGTCWVSIRYRICGVRGERLNCKRSQSEQRD